MSTAIKELVLWVNVHIAEMCPSYCKGWGFLDSTVGPGNCMLHWDRRINGRNCNMLLTWAVRSEINIYHHYLFKSFVVHMPRRELLCLCKFMHYHQHHHCHPLVLNVSANVRYPVITSVLFFYLSLFLELDDYTHYFYGTESGLCHLLLNCIRTL